VGYKNNDGCGMDFRELAYRGLNAVKGEVSALKALKEER
jgi:hypothetical protein